MKLSKDFSVLLDRAYEHFNSSELTQDSNNKWGFYTSRMFALEDIDFDKTLAILQHKIFENQLYRDSTIESVISSKKSYGTSLGLSKGIHSRFFGIAHMLPDEIRKECSSIRSRRKNQLLEEMLDEAWYSQSDYQLVMRTALDVEILCEFWYTRTLNSQQEEEMKELHSKLCSL